MIIKDRQPERPLHTLSMNQSQQQQSEHYGVVQYYLKEYKSIFNFVFYGSTTCSLFLNVKAWFLGLSVNEFLTYTVSAVAILTGVLKGISYITDIRKSNADRKRINLESKVLEEKIKRDNRSWSQN